MQRASLQGERKLDQENKGKDKDRKRASESCLAITYAFCAITSRLKQLEVQKGVF